MEAFLSFFESMASWQKLLWIFVCLGFCWFLESLLPAVNFNYKKVRHAGINLIFLGSNVVINLIYALLIGSTLTVFQDNNVGLFFSFNTSPLIELILSLLLLDLASQYFAHYLMHKIPALWRLHIIHHSDTHVDATSGPRLHPVEFMIRETLAYLVVIAFGIPVAAFILYRMATVLFSFLTHANIALPESLDRIVRLVFITPSVHKFHHHARLPWTDKNYGNIFSFWDRIFGTFVFDDVSKIEYGLDNFNDEYENDISYLMRSPFTKKRSSKHPKR